MRGMTRTESYLHERCKLLRQETPDPILHEVALRGLVDEVADACGNFVGEMNDAMFRRFIAGLSAKAHAMSRGYKPEIKIGLPPPLVATLAPPPEPEPEPEPAAPEPEPAPAAFDPFIPGGILKMHRDRLGWTQAKLGHEVGLSGSTICSMEKCKRDGSRGDYLALRVVLGLPLEAA